MTGSKREKGLSMKKQMSKRIKSIWLEFTLCTAVVCIILVAAVAPILADATHYQLGPMYLYTLSQDQVNVDTTSYLTVNLEYWQIDSGYQYIYKITNNIVASENGDSGTDFAVQSIYLTFNNTGISDYSDFFAPINWGDFAGSQPVEGTPYVHVHNGTGVEIEWTAIDPSACIAPGATADFGFICSYAPSTVLNDIGSGSTVLLRNYNGDIYGPTGTLANNNNIVPEWSSIMLALAGLSCIRVTRFRSKVRED